jgi:hypothetical protein
MIVGGGDIAGVLKDRPGFIWFASGVSNSQEDREAEYGREIDLLMAQDKTKHLVYFSSLSIYYADGRYQIHKRQMEEIIKTNWKKHTIVRLGNISWGTNPHTLINFLKNHPEAEIRDEYRFVIDKEEFLWWMNLIPNWNTELNIPGRRLKVREIRELYCE